MLGWREILIWMRFAGFIFVFLYFVSVVERLFGKIRVGFGFARRGVGRFRREDWRV